MSTAQFKLDMFEGPLDLLLHLINKHKLNIYDIEIAVLLEQYLEYMAGLEEEDYEDAADFLEMAARLIYIKTVSLLPKDNEGEELKKELEGSLIEYSLCKMAAARLREQYAGGEIFVREPVKLPINKTFTGEYEPEALLNAYLGMNEKARSSKPLRAEMFKPLLSRRVVSVTSKIIHVLKMLITRGECFLDSMYDGCADKSERVAVFLAVLELTKSGRIFLNDDNTRVYMNSAAKNRRISSDFDEAEIAAEKAAEDISALPADGDTAADTSLSAANDDRENGDSPDIGAAASLRKDEPPRYAIPEAAPLPYHNAEPPARTVYKGETKQRGTLPVLRIELSPELRRLVGEDITTDDMPTAVSSAATAPEDAARAETLAEEVAENAVEVEIPAAEVGAENAVAVEIPAAEVGAESALAVDKPAVEVGAESASAVETPAVEVGAESAVKTPAANGENFPAGASADISERADDMETAADTVSENAPSATMVSDDGAVAVEIPALAVEISAAGVGAESAVTVDKPAVEVSTESAVAIDMPAAEVGAETTLTVETPAVEVGVESAVAIDKPAAEVSAESALAVEISVAEVGADSVSAVDKPAVEVGTERALAVETSVANGEDSPAGVSADISARADDMETAADTVSENAPSAAMVSDDGADKPAMVVPTDDEAHGDGKPDDSAAVRYRPNLFGARYYWRAYGWAAGRLRL